MSEDSSNGQGVAWFLAGLGVGALIGILYAPKSGRETREDLAQGARDGSEYLRVRGRQAAERAGQMVDKGKEQVNQYVGAGHSGKTSSSAARTWSRTSPPASVQLSMQGAKPTRQMQSRLSPQRDEERLGWIPVQALSMFRISCRLRRSRNRRISSQPAFSCVRLSR